jgi:hypothetical protein
VIVVLKDSIELTNEGEVKPFCHVPGAVAALSFVAVQMSLPSSRISTLSPLAGAAMPIAAGAPHVNSVVQVPLVAIVAVLPDVLSVHNPYVGVVDWVTLSVVPLLFSGSDGILAAPASNLMQRILLRPSITTGSLCATGSSVSLAGYSDASACASDGAQASAAQASPRTSARGRAGEACIRSSPFECV